MLWGFGQRKKGVIHKTVSASPGQLALRCDCGNMTFGGFVNPLDPRTARLSQLVCLQCSKVFGIGVSAILDGNGQVAVETNNPSAPNIYRNDKKNGVNVDVPLGRFNKRGLL